MKAMARDPARRFESARRSRLLRSISLPRAANRQAIKYPGRPAGTDRSTGGRMHFRGTRWPIAKSQSGHESLFSRRRDRIPGRSGEGERSPIRIAQAVQGPLRRGVERVVSDGQLVPGAGFRVTVQGSARLAELAQQGWVLLGPLGLPHDESSVFSRSSLRAVSRNGSAALVWPASSSAQTSPNTVSRSSGSDCECDTEVMQGRCSVALRKRQPVPGSGPGRGRRILPGRGVARPRSLLLACRWRSEPGSQPPRNHRAEAARAPTRPGRSAPIRR